MVSCFVLQKTDFVPMRLFPIPLDSAIWLTLAKRLRVDVGVSVLLDLSQSLKTVSGIGQSWSLTKVVHLDQVVMNSECL